MTDVPRREIDELITKYELHPSLFDIYVEGEFDRHFLDLYVTIAAIESSVSSFPIDAIEISNDQLTKLGLSSGSHKSRVIALAMLLEQRFGKVPSNVTCLVDADTDRVLNRLKTTHHVWYTDYTCMEMYALNLATLTKFFTLTCNLDETHINKFLEIAATILPQQFLARAVNDRLNLNVVIPDFSSGLKIKRDLVSFEQKKYFQVFFDKLAGSQQKELAKQEIGNIQKTLNKELRNKAHGHDFIALLFEYLWANKGPKLQSKGDDVVKFGARLLATALDPSTLSTENLFASLSHAACGNSFMCK